MPIYRIWERGVYKGESVEALKMRLAVAKFAGCNVLHLYGMVNLSTKSNPCGWIDEAGEGRQFTAYEVQS